VKVFELELSSLLSLCPASLAQPKISSLEQLPHNFYILAAGIAFNVNNNHLRYTSLTAAAFLVFC